MKWFPILFLLAACSTVDIKSQPVKFEPMTVPEPRPLNLSNVEWKVYNVNDMKALVAESKAKGKRFLLFGLDDENYTILDANMQDIYRYILEMKAEKDFYKNLELNREEPQTRK